MDPFRFFGTGEDLNFFFNDTATTEIYTTVHTLSLHDALPIWSTAARLKLKGIDGGPHKRWSMWFNSKQREEPYLGLTCWCKPVETSAPLRSASTGAAWLSSARVVRCWVKSRNERNPRSQLPASHVGDSGGTAGVKPEEGGDDVKSSRPLRPGRHTYYNAWYSASPTREGEPIAKSRAKFGLQSATRLHEAGIASNRGSATPR